MNKIEEKAKSIPVHWNGHCSALEWPMNPCSFLWIFCQPFSEIYRVSRQSPLCTGRCDKTGLLQAGRGCAAGASRRGANQSDGDSTGANNRVCFQFIGASSPNELRQTKSSGSRSE